MSSKTSASFAFRITIEPAHLDPLPAKSRSLGSVAHHGAEHEVHIAEVPPRRIGHRLRLGRRQNQRISSGIRKNPLHHSRRPQPRSENEGSSTGRGPVVLGLI